jgi:hypothetical protein
MDAILRDVTEVTTIMKQIASASEEQSKGISQVGHYPDGRRHPAKRLAGGRGLRRRRRWSARPKIFSARCRSSA